MLTVLTEAYRATGEEGLVPVIATLLSSHLRSLAAKYPAAEDDLLSDLYACAKDPRYSDLKDALHDRAKNRQRSEERRRAQEQESGRGGGEEKQAPPDPMLRARMARAISRLSPSDWEILQELSRQEEPGVLAVRWGISPEAARQRICQARARYRRALVREKASEDLF